MQPKWDSSFLDVIISCKQQLHNTIQTGYKPIIMFNIRRLLTTPFLGNTMTHEFYSSALIQSLGIFDKLFEIEK